MTKKTLLTLSAFAVVTLTSQAATLTSWDFSGLDYLTDHTTNTTITNPILGAADGNALTGSSVTDLTPDGATLQYSSGVAANTVVGEADLKNWGAGGYMEFTLTADAGQTINFTDINLSAYRNGAGAADSFTFQVNLDGAGFVQYGSTIAAGTPGAGNYTDYNFGGNLTTADGGNAIIRFSATGGNGNIHINGLTVTGDITATAVPEPSSTALLGLGGLALILRRRK